MFFRCSPLRAVTLVWVCVYCVGSRRSPLLYMLVSAALGYCVKFPQVHSCHDMCERTHEQTNVQPGAFSKFLGTDAMWVNAVTELPIAGSCANESEEVVFRRTCASTIAAFDAHLQQTHRRRALFWSIDGESNVGWGHALPMAAALHTVCRRMHRYCYISLYDLQLGSFFRHANGMSWAMPPAREVRGHFANMSRVRVNTKQLFAHPEDFVEELARHDAADLIIAHHVGALPWQDDSWLPWWLPLRARHASASVPDRCFNRYLTAPGQLLQEQIRARGEAHFAAVFHLRTMFADVPQSLYRRHDDAESARLHANQWLGEACGEVGVARLTKSGTLAISDSPGIMLQLRMANPKMAVSAVVDLPANQSTRSWRASKPAIFATHVATALDVHRASLASMAQVSGSSFLKAAAMRSMCLREITSLTGASGGACVNFTRTFVRDLPKFLPLGRHAKLFPSCVEPQLAASHPCKNVSSLACRESYLTATSNSL